MNLVLAHTGHWLANLMYVAPVVVIAGWIAITSIRQRNIEPTKNGDSAKNGDEDS
jgi:hypothetical protein